MIFIDNDLINKSVTKTICCQVSNGIKACQQKRVIVH